MGYWWSFHKCFKVVLMMCPGCSEGIECFSMFFLEGGSKVFRDFFNVVSKTI